MAQQRLLPDACTHNSLIQTASSLLFYVETLIPLASFHAIDVPREDIGGLEDTTPFFFHFQNQMINNSHNP